MCIMRGLSADEAARFTVHVSVPVIVILFAYTLYCLIRGRPDFMMLALISVWLAYQTNELHMLTRNRMAHLHPLFANAPEPSTTNPRTSAGGPPAAGGRAPPGGGGVQPAIGVLQPPASVRVIGVEAGGRLPVQTFDPMPAMPLQWAQATPIACAQPVQPCGGGGGDVTQASLVPQPSQLGDTTNSVTLVQAGDVDRRV